MGRKLGSRNKSVRVPKVKLTCATCQCVFEKWPSELVRRPILYCSMACRRQVEDVQGKEFGFLTVLRQGEEKSHGQRTWVCRCACGAEVTVPGYSLRDGHTKSCGCKKAEMAALANTTHGMAGKKNKAPEYRVWGMMIQRCENPKCNRYYSHGARGITVCQRWRQSFEAFLEDMGRRPQKGLSLERRDNDGNYEPANCYWATRKQQGRNTRRNHMVTVNGQTKTLAEWSEISGMSASKIRRRLQLGWPPERACGVAQLANS